MEEKDCRSCNYYRIDDNHWCYCLKKQKVIFRQLGYRPKICKDFIEKPTKKYIAKKYGKIYFEKNLPQCCGECPFNYDTIACLALSYDERDEELSDCLDGNNKKYSKCPIRLLKKQ